MDKEFAFKELQKFRKTGDISEYQFHLGKVDNGYSLTKQGKEITLLYNTNSDLLRGYNAALGLINGQLDQKISTHTQFKQLIGMLDLARNAVLSVETLKKELCRFAGLGYTEIWLYLEDEFEIPEDPYFGLQRGRYSQDQLHELAVYADQLGITLVPAIQTLAHLKNVFKWQKYNDLRDTTDNLYVGKERVKDFVKKELIAASKPFLTNKIHIGMDEAYSIGLGKYYFDHQDQPIDQEKLIQQHAQMVFELCKELNLEPMMWSDMWFEIGSPINMMYDPKADFSKFHVDPKIDQVYWDYYSTDKKHYLPVMKKHFELTDNVYFASGIWTWGRLAPNQSKMLASIKAGLEAAKEEGITKIAATAWRDDSAETPFAASYLGWQVFSDYQYHKDPTERDFADDFKLLQNEDYQSYLLLDKFDNYRGTVNDKDMIPSKLLLYEDLIQPRVYQNFKHASLTDYYHNLAEKLSDAIPSENSALMFDYYIELAKTLSQKAHLLNNLSKNYGSDQELLDYSNELRILANERRKLWFKENKQNGSEIMDIRFGGMLERIKTVQYLLRHHKYQMEIPEVEMDKHIDDEFGNARYFEIVSPSDISW